MNSNHFYFVLYFLTFVSCVIGGTGMLGIPRAVAEAGWLGSLLIVLALVMSTYTGHILIECLYLKT